MKKTIAASITLAVFALTSQTAMAGNDINAKKIFSKKCKMCHSLTRKKFGPAFKDMNKDPEVLLTTITNGRKAMPKFNKKLSSDEIAAMVSFIQSQ
ncbi:MAG: c-type cytochrome [Mariprofundaceae bacterium]|nr:c-type cytochrome [Mariprofundaceae bacterium]